MKKGRQPARKVAIVLSPNTKRREAREKSFTALKKKRKRFRGRRSMALQREARIGKKTSLPIGDHWGRRSALAAWRRGRGNLGP